MCCISAIPKKQDFNGQYTRWKQAVWYNSTVCVMSLYALKTSSMIQFNSVSMSIKKKKSVYI